MGSSRKIATACATLILALSAHAECVSTIRAVSQPTVFPNRAAGPVAWSGSVLAVAKNDADNNNRPIYVSTYDLNLNPLTSDRKAADQTLGGAIALVWNGVEFGLFYQTPAMQLVLQRISAAGELIGGAVPIAPGLNRPGQEYDIQWEPTRGRYVVIRTIPQGIEKGLVLTMTDRAGITQFEQVINFLLADPATPKIAVGANGALGITWLLRENQEAPDQLFFIFVNPNNVPGTPYPVSTVGRGPRIASNGTQFIIMDQAPGGGGTTELRWIRINNSGVQTNAEAKFLSGRGVDVLPVSLLWNGSEWALAYLDAIIGLSQFPGDYRLRRFTTGGATISDTLFTPDSNKSSYSTTYPFLWNGQSYVSPIAHFISAAEGSDSYLVSHCPLIAAMTASTTTVATRIPVTFTANVSGGSPPYTVSWDFGDFTEVKHDPTVAHAFERTGTYTVTLSIVDVAGGTAVATKTITVLDCDNVLQTITLSSSNAAPKVGEVVTLSVNASSCVPAQEYTIDFGDGTSGTTVANKITHQYKTAGAFVAKIV